MERKNFEECFYVNLQAATNRDGSPMHPEVMDLPSATIGLATSHSEGLTLPQLRAQIEAEQEAERQGNLSRYIARGWASTPPVEGNMTPEDVATFRQNEAYMAVLANGNDINPSDGWSDTTQNEDEEYMNFLMNGNGPDDDDDDDETLEY